MSFLKEMAGWFTVQPNIVSTDTQSGRRIESFRINGVCILSGLILEKMDELSFPRDKANCL